jgi:hypothetical protein
MDPPIAYHLNIASAGFLISRQPVVDETAETAHL